MSRLVKTIQLLLLAAIVPAGARAQALSETDAMFSEPSMSGNRAVVRMQRLDRGSYARIPVYSQTIQLNLVRGAGGWRVVSRNILSES